MRSDGLNRYERYRLKDVDAYRKKKREWAKTPEQRKKRCEYQQRWRDANRVRYNALMREVHGRHRDQYNKSNRNRYYLGKYGITAAARDALVKNGTCEICGNAGALHIDHDHNTKASWRGLLCMVCNTHCGWVERVGLAAITKYLAKGAS